MEPSSSSAVIGVTLTVGTVSIAGTLLGMHYDSLLFGLLGGLIFLSRSERRTRFEAITSVIASIIIAGVAAPILGSWLYTVHSSMERVGYENIRRASAMLIGGGWHVGIPITFDVIRGLLDKWLDKDSGRGSP